MTQRTLVPATRFDATLYTIDKWTILRLPGKASAKLPSRGQVAIRGTINGHKFRTVLEPDGQRGHWMRVDKEMQRTAGLNAGNTATLEIESTKDWPEPKVPQDFERAMDAAPQKIQDMWKAITPMARWEWIRWVNATKNADTRKRRVEVTISKMNSGKRRPCCFDLSACTDPYLSTMASFSIGRDSSGCFQFSALAFNQMAADCGGPSSRRIWPKLVLNSRLEGRTRRSM
jgi:hypothetical protein